MTTHPLARRLALAALMGACLCQPLAAKTPGEVEVGQVLREAQMQGPAALGQTRHQVLLDACVRCAGGRGSEMRGNHDSSYLHRLV